MKILLPLDLIQPVKPIVEELSRQVPLEGSSVKLLFVRETLPSFESLIKTIGEFPEDWDKQVGHKAQAHFDEITPLLKAHGAEVTSEITPGPPAMMIEAVVRDEKFDLVVVTPARHNIAERLFLGSVSGKVVKHASCTVLMLHAGDSKSGPIQNVVIGVDGSAGSKAAVSQCVALFGLLKSKPRIYLVHSVDIAEPLKLFTPVSFVAQVEQNLLMEGQTYLADGKRILSEIGDFTVESLLKEGDPGAQLIAVAKQLKADMLVVGAQGHTAVEHFLLGNTAHSVSTHAPCTVAVIKPAAQAGAKR